MLTWSLGGSQTDTAPHHLGRLAYGHTRTEPMPDERSEIYIGLVENGCSHEKCQAAKGIEWSIGIEARWCRIAVLEPTVA